MGCYDLRAKDSPPATRYFGSTRQREPAPVYGTPVLALLSAWRGGCRRAGGIYGAGDPQQGGADRSAADAAEPQLTAIAIDRGRGWRRRSRGPRVQDQQPVCDRGKHRIDGLRKAGLPES